MSEGESAFSEKNLQKFFQDAENHANSNAGERKTGAPPRYLEMPELTREFNTNLTEHMGSYGTKRIDVLQKLGQIVDSEGEKKLPFSGLQEYMQAERQDLETFAKLFEKNVPKEWQEAREIVATARDGIEQTRSGDPKPVNVYVVGTGDEKTYTLDETKGTLYFTFVNPDHWVGIHTALHPMDAYLNAHKTQTEDVESVAKKMQKSGENLRSLADRPRTITLSYLHQQREHWQSEQENLENSDQNRIAERNFKIFDTFYKRVEDVWTTDEVSLARGRKIERARQNPRGKRIQHIQR